MTSLLRTALRGSPRGRLVSEASPVWDTAAASRGGSDSVGESARASRVQVGPASRDLRAGFVDKPTISGNVAKRAGSVDELSV